MTFAGGALKLEVFAAGLLKLVRFVPGECVTFMLEFVAFVTGPLELVTFPPRLEFVVFALRLEFVTFVPGLL